MPKKLFISIIACLTSFFAFSQVATTNSYSLRVIGDSRDVNSFNDAGAKINITTAVLENEKIGITIKKPGDKNYKLYLFDEVALNKYPFSVKNYRDLYNWAKNFTELTLKPFDFNIRFDGVFIDYSQPWLTRTVWSKEGYFGFMEGTSANFDSYRVKTGELDENSELKIIYVFLVTESGRRDEVVIGLTQPVVHTIPKNIIESFLPKEEEEALPEPVEEDKLVKKWDNEVGMLLVIFEDKTSYEEIIRDTKLKRIYEQHRYENEIEGKIREINKELAGDEYEADRERLVAIFSRYKKTEPVAVTAQVETKTENPAEKVPPPKVQPQREAAPARRQTVDKCAGLKQKFGAIGNAILRLEEEMKNFDKTVSEGIVGMRIELEECGENECYAVLKRNFDNKGWEQSLAAFETRLNRQAMDLQALEQDADFESCDLSTSDLSEKMDVVRDERRLISGKLSDFRIEIEGNLINREAFTETVAAFAGIAQSIVAGFMEYDKAYTRYDNRLFDTGTLDKNSIRYLKNISSQTDSVMYRIEQLIREAENHYNQLTNNVGYFPEATFKQETQLKISENDCQFLKANLDNLIARAEKTRRGGYGTEIIFGIVILLLLIGGYSYFMGMVKRKTNEKKRVKSPGNSSPIMEKKGSESMGGIEIIDDDEEMNKGKGLDMVRKLAGIKYYEVDVQSFISNTSVRKVYFSKDFVINAYRYFEDKMLHMGNGSIEDLYEYGGFIVGNWDISLYDKDQYDISLEHFVKPGPDAKFSKFNIDFGYDISFRMEEMLIDYSQHGNEQVFTGWLHSHPGHNVFLSNYDIEVQETFKNNYHPHRHIALVLEPTTPRWDMGLFTFNKSGQMNNKEDVRSLLSFHDIYSWAIGEKQGEKTDSHLKFNIEGPSLLDSKTISFDRSALLSVKIFIERELSTIESNQSIFFLTGIQSHNGKLGQDLHIVNIQKDDKKKTPGLEHIGIFTVALSGNDFSSFTNELKELTGKDSTSFILVYQLFNEAFKIVPLKPNGDYYPEDYWLEFRKSDMIPYLSK